MKIAFNPSTVAALIAPPNNKDITFDLRGHNIFARGVKFCGTDTNTWRDIKINNVSIDSNILDLRDGDNTTLTNINGVVTINSTWRPVVDNLTSDSTTSSLSANQGRILKALIDGKSDSDHNHDDRYLRLTGGWMSGDINFGGDNKIYWGRNTDSASISFKNDGDRDADSYMSFVTSDNGNEYFRWSHSSGSTNTEWMSLRSDGLRVGGTKVSLEGHTHDDRYVKKSGDTMLGALNFANGTWNLVGDDSYMGDCNMSGHFGIKAANTTYPGISFFNNANDHLGNLTAYSGNIKYGAYSLQFLDNGNTSVSASTWMNPFSDYNSNAVADGQAICVWGLSSYLGNLANDSGDMSLWLRRVNANVATLNMVLDGEYYANGNLRLAHVSEIPTALKNPYALTISLNGTSQGPYDGSAAKNINITPSSIGAATSDHNHDGRYVYNYGGTQMDGASINKNALGMATNSGITEDWWHILQAAWNGEYRWNSLIAFPTLNRNGMYYRSGLDDNTAWGAWVKLLDANNYSSTLDSRYYTESEIDSLLDAKLNRQNLSYGAWNPRGYNLAADYYYNGGDLSISENDGKIYVSIDGLFYQNEGLYRVLDTSDVAGLKNNLTVHLHLSNTDTTWYPLIWGGSSHSNTSDSTGEVYKSYDKLSWLTSSLTLYATNIQTENIKHLSIGGGIYWNPYVESTTDGSDAASITLVKSGVAGGTTLVLSLMNDANNTILFQTNGSARLYHNSYPILTTLNTYVSNNKGYINGTEITLVNNADTVDNYHETAFPRLVGIKGNTWNWNDVIRAGYYKIQSGTITNHPSGIYPFGMAEVITTENHNDGENRELQIYYPHSQTNNIAIWLRMHNSSTQGNGWGSWVGVPNTNGNIASATKLQTPRTIWGQSFDGTGNVDNTLRIRQTTSNWCEGIRIQNGDNTWATIILGATSDYGTNDNAWSIHRKDDNNFAISRNSSDGINGLVMTSVGMGLGTTSPTQRLDVAGNIRTTGNLYISHATNNNMNYDTSNPRVVFSESGSLAVGLVYTDYDSYRPSKGLKVMDVDNNDTGNVWFEVLGYNYSSGYVKTGSSSSYVLLGDGDHKLESALNVANADTVDGFHYNDFTYKKYIGYNRNGPYNMKIFSKDISSLTWGASYLIFDIFSSGYNNNRVYFGKYEVSLGHWNDTDKNPTVYSRWIFKTNSAYDCVHVIKDLSNYTVDVYIENNLWDCSMGLSIIAIDGFNMVSSNSWVNLPSASGTVLLIDTTYLSFMGNADMLDGYHASGLLTSVTNTNNGISITVGGTTKSVSNISVNYASSAGNADTLDGFHASSSNKPWGTIPVITTLGYMDIGNDLEFHYDNTTGSDYSTALMCQGNYSNIVYLPSASGTLALTSDIPTTLPANGGNADTTDGVHITWAGELTSTNHLVAWEANGSALRDINPANVSVGNSDKLDGYHENSFLRYRGNTGTDLEATLWNLIGIKEYYGALPDNLTGVYNYGSVISLPGSSSRFEIYASHLSSNGNGLYYRSGWDSDKKTWLKFIDSSNIGSQSVNYANSAGNADSVDGYHASSFLIDRGGNYTGLLYDLPCKSIFSGYNLSDAPTTGWLSGIVLGSNWNSSHYLHYLVESGSRWYATRGYSNGKMTNWNTFAYLTDNVASATNAYHLRINSANTWSTWYWAGLSGLPSWLWGSNDGTNMYVWDPNNFNVHTALYLRSLGNLNCQTGRTLNYGDVYTYNTIYGNTGAPTDYTSVIGFGRGIGGTVEIAGGWCNTGLYWRSLRDCCEDWYSWRTVLDSSNYTGYVDNYYWANVKISTSSSTTTSPTVSNLTATNSIRMGNISLEHTDEINNITNGGIYLNYRTSGNVSLCYGGGNVGIGNPSPSYKLDVNGLMRASGFHHSSMDSNNYMLLAGGGYKSFGGDYNHPVFLGYLNLDHGDDGTISSSFYCLGYSVSFTYTRGGNYCKIYIPDTSYQTFYIKAAIASVNYSGGGMDTWTGYRRGDGAWWLHCYAYGSNEVRVKGFRLANDTNDSWWGGNPLWSSNGGANKITVCIFGYVTFK